MNIKTIKMSRIAKSASTYMPLEYSFPKPCSNAVVNVMLHAIQRAMRGPNVRRRIKFMTSTVFRLGIWTVSPGYELGVVG
jgi:hypothetical protein